MPIMRQLDLRGQLLTEAKIDSLLPRSKHDGLSAEQVAVEVIAGVKIGGASYLRKLTQDLDGFDPEPLRVSSKELQSALASCDAALRSAIEMAIERNRLVSQAAMPKPFTIELANGSKVSQRYVPMDSVGLYAPGGKAVYPSRDYECGTRSSRQGSSNCFSQPWTKAVCRTSPPKCSCYRSNSWFG